MTNPSPSALTIIVLIALVFHPSECFVVHPLPLKAGRLADVAVLAGHEKIAPKQPSKVVARPATLLYASSSESDEDNAVEEITKDSLKDDLLGLLKETPSNTPTSLKLTGDILAKIDELESQCPTPDEEVLGSLAGNWELLWTAQDIRSTEWRRNPLRSWINPLENQAYSNNPDGGPTGRSNPFLPRRIQDRLERMGVNQGSARSSQLVDLGKGRVRNIVTFRFPGRRQRQATLIVDIKFKPNAEDDRQVDVRFQACRLIVPNTRLKAKFPLGPLGPRGWLRTDYIDDTLRITRGHKGSVFVLARTGTRIPVDEKVAEATPTVFV